MNDGTAGTYSTRTVDPVASFGSPGIRLADVAKRVNSALKDASRGKLKASRELIPLESAWTQRGYDKESGGLTFNQWIGDFSGVRHQDWRLYFDASEAVGTNWDTQAAVWVTQKYGGDLAALAAIKGAVLREWKARARGDFSYPPLSCGKVVAIVRKLYPGERRRRASKECAECERLRGLLAAAGVSAE